MTDSRRSLLGVVAALLAVLAGAGAGLLWSVLGPTTYSATGTVFVKFNFPATEPDPFSAQQFVTQRIDSYAQLATSPALLAAVSQDIPGHSLDQLASAIEVAAVPGSALIDATATSSDPNTAAKLADAVLARLAIAVSSAEGAGVEQSSPVLMPLIQPAITPEVANSSVDVVKVLGGGAAGVVAGALLWWAFNGGGTSAGRRPVPRHAKPADRA
ncbi:hypothetical protein [Mycobacterium sp. C31M]